MKWNLRVITNLHCNERCYFCYQKDKREMVLNKMALYNYLKIFNVTTEDFAREGYPNIECGLFERGAIYGGEPTLLDDLSDYIQIVKPYCEVLSMTTNGTILTKEKMSGYTKAGLDEMGIANNR